MSDRMIIARDGWGEDVPDWVCALVKACDSRGASQNSVAGRVGVTGAVISQVLRNKYPARTDRIEARVRAIFLDGQISCPALGKITSESCLNWRDASHALNSVSPARVQMFRACKACPRNAIDHAEDIT
jgi:hypothetical protein